MITEDELRDRLRAESVSLMPRDDLLQAIATRHARRHKRARAGLIGGSLAATALVVALLGGLFTSGTPLPIDPASPGKAEIVKRAREATAAANNMIMHFSTDQGGSTVPSAESWALRSEKLARIRWSDKSDKIVRPNYKEEIDYPRRTIWFNELYRVGDDVVAEVSGSGIGDPISWFDDITETSDTGGDIHLAGKRMGLKFDVWLDARNHLPKRAVFGSYTMTIDWLPATAENRKLLEHTIPDEFGRRAEEPPGGSIIPTR
jgi:hypothetical protein